MGHNDIDYEHKYDTTNKTLSYTLNNPIQDQLIIDGLLWLGDAKAKAMQGNAYRMPPVRTRKSTLSEIHFQSSA
jgi:hypothetical protein